MKKVFLLVMLSFVMGACAQSPDKQFFANDLTAKQSDDPTKQEYPVNPKITLAAIGDILIHAPVYRDAQTADGYDFTPMFENTAPYLEEATIAIANQETMIGGADFGLSGYPAFNSPTEVGDALKESGIDVVSIANNHTLDRGEQAINNSLSHWESIDMIYTGAYKSQKDQKKLRVIQTEEGIDVAFLSYTYGTNGIPLPSGKNYLVNLIDEQKIKSDITRANKQADAVVVSVHFGSEYERMPNRDQKELAQVMADAGAHVILGHHPHVLQPIEMLEGKKGNDTLVIYSLGNFISAQEEIHRRIGGILQVEIELDRHDDSIALNKPSFVPTIVDYEPFTDGQAGTDFQVIPMHETKRVLIPDQEETYKEIKDHMSQWLPELDLP
ncbi:CapA family protein [Thalassobacillus sp. B23F22_16]|uniref:CapA family protein n=1 Tax=Thalassobacillus sp. B23F22_16 TaxID=3459513 RepID=UPI00373E4E33